MRRHRFHRGVAKRTAHEEAIDGMKLAIRQLSLRLQGFTLGVDVDLQHARTAIFGPSGAGKTSLLEIIAGLRKPDTANISFNGQLFDDSSRNYSLPVRLRKLGYVPQYDSLFPHLSVQRNLLYGSNGKPKDHTLGFHHVIDFLQIGHLLDRQVRSLSRGENQRVVIARALLSAPQLLLLDEPLTSLDAKLKNAILQQLQALHREFGIPVLFVTHDPAEAIAICEEVLLLEAGRITARGNPAELLV
jgi:molybdate transport system ATP-binding protein